MEFIAEDVVFFPNTKDVIKKIFLKGAVIRQVPVVTESSYLFGLVWTKKDEHAFFILIVKAAVQDLYI